MPSKDQTIKDLLEPADFDHASLNDAEAAHFVVHHNKVIASQLVDGVHFDVDEQENGINGRFRVDEGVIVQKPVQICFGMLAQEGVQNIDLNIHIEKNASVSVFAHCIFPNAVNVEHNMNADICIEEGGTYSYFEKHIHSPHKGLSINPKAKVHVKANGRFKTEFELLKGRVGKLHIDYETYCDRNAVMDMNARVSGRADDEIIIKETGHLQEERARGILTSRIALQDTATADIQNKITAAAAYCKGHVDCKEIIQDKAKASAIPIVEVSHPQAHVTHEAAIGSVDNKQLETLMSRGLNEKEAVDLIINGLLQ